MLRRSRIVFSLFLKPTALCARSLDCLQALSMFVGSHNVVSYLSSRLLVFWPSTEGSTSLFAQASALRFFQIVGKTQTKTLFCFSRASCFCLLSAHNVLFLSRPSDKSVSYLSTHIQWFMGRQWVKKKRKRKETGRYLVSVEWPIDNEWKIIEAASFSFYRKSTIRPRSWPLV